jgi:hypothetical protein
VKTFRDAVIATGNPDRPDGRHGSDFLHDRCHSGQRRLPVAGSAATSARSAQALSADDGRTRETNWTAEFTGAG